ncbi:response regulator [Paenibacillus sp. P25]|nr:response regulator [Paenibacillus sp. P25]
MREFAVAEDVLAASGFLLIGAYFLAMFLMRGQQRSWLYFGLCCSAVSVYLVTHGEKIAAMLVPDIPYELFWKIQVLSGLVAEIFLLLYTRHSFPSVFKKAALIAFGATGVVRLFLILFTSASTFSPFGTVSFALAFVEILYVAFVMVVGVIRRMEGSVYMLISALSLLVIEVVTTMDTLGIATVFSVQMFAWLGFVLAQWSLLSKRFVNTFAAVEKLSERLQFMDRLKDEFLANTSHEMKTPLHGIINIAQSLLEGAAGSMSPQQKTNVAMIAETGKRMANLLGDLLDFSKLKNGELVLKRQAVALRPIVHVIFEMFRYMAGDKPVRFVDLLHDRHFVYADEDRLMQILNNLIGNALKFTASGRITVSAREEKGWLAVSVSDTGIGIPGDKLEAIFESFEQAGSAVAREYGGTGLGLSITKRLVELHGGSIWAESEPGGGAVFTFTVPLAAGGDERLTGPGRKKTNAPAERPVLQTRLPNNARLEGHGGYTILVADDDAANRQVLLNLLSVENYTVIAVSSGMEAMREMERSRSIDLAVIDLMMPGMSGYEVCRNIRKRYTLSESPVLLLTARNRPEDIMTAFDAGVNDFLGKPVEAGELKARIRTLLEMKRSVSELIHIETAFLQAQIKPHFLFNTLNTVISVSHKDVGKAQDLLVELSQYLRSSFDFQNREQLVSIRKELELVESYLYIEKARFGQRPQVTYDMDEEIYCLIPPLIIQPIVENAVRHGVMKRPGGGTVRISVKLEHDVLVIMVADDGPGISEETKAALSKGRTVTRGVGLANIEGRLKKLYGTGLKIDSVPGQGAQVTIRIPISI